MSLVAAELSRNRLSVSRREKTATQLDGPAEDVPFWKGQFDLLAVPPRTVGGQMPRSSLPHEHVPLGRALFGDASRIESMRGLTTGRTTMLRSSQVPAAVRESGRRRIVGAGSQSHFSAAGIGGD